MMHCCLQVHRLRGEVLAMEGALHCERLNLVRRNKFWADHKSHCMRGAPKADVVLPQVHRLRGEVLEMEGALQRAHCGRLELVREKLRLAAALSAATGMLAGAHDTHVRREEENNLRDLISPHAGLPELP